MQPLVEAERLSKKFSKSIHCAMRYALSDITKNFLGRPLRRETLRPQEFWALQDIRFELQPGSAMAVVGSNGSGKSTLLKLIQGIYEPDGGSLAVRGRAAALVRVAASFHPEYTGRENIFINASVLGLKRRAIQERISDIIEFADIGDFIDSPVKYYSKGMYMRLGFSVAVHSDFNLLLIDEALAVGDTAFVAKCKEKIRDLIKQGTGMILVTHNLSVARNLCDSALWLHKGKAKAYGTFEDICAQYRDFQEPGLKLTQDLP